LPRAEFDEAGRRRCGFARSLSLGLPLGVAALVGACGGPGADGPLREHARVSVAASVVDAIARERGINPEQALALGGEDALLAQELEAGAPELGRWIERVVFARQVLSALADEGRAGGPPTDAEVTAISDARFWELARPRMVQVAHAVVLSPEEDPAARALAERIRVATSEVKTDAEFQAAANAVDAGRFSVKVEELLPVTADGRAVDPAAPPPAGPTVQHYDGDFSAAAQRLTRPGEQSPVLRSPFGYHVLYARAIIEPKQPSLDERRSLLHDEIMSQRAAALSAALLERQRRELAPTQSRSALASMQQLSVPKLSLRGLAGQP
jgi:PPIC-type PPIASE domain